LKLDTPSLPAWSCAVQSTRCRPNEKKEDEPGTQDTGTCPSTASIAVGFV
jgi:hypothetical protein